MFPVSSMLACMPASSIKTKYYSVNFVSLLKCIQPFINGFRIVQWEIDKKVFSYFRTYAYVSI